MAANFESGVTFGKKSWHGQELNREQLHPHRFSVTDSLADAGLTWSVAKVPLGVFGEAGVPTELHGAGLMGAYGIYRTMPDGTVELFSGVTVGERYECLQNSEIFQWFQPFLDTKRVAIETAGSLDGGKRVWAMAAMLDENGEPEIDLGGGEKLRRNLLLAGSHDGTLATRVGMCHERVVCQNTLNMALGEGGFLRVKHTTGQLKALEVVRETLDLATGKFKATEEQFRKMLTCGINRSDLKDYVLKVFEVKDETEMSGKMKNMVADCIRSAVGGVGQDGKLTVWSAYNGVTEFLTHRRLKDGEARTKSLWFGDSASMGTRAFTLATALAS